MVIRKLIVCLTILIYTSPLLAVNRSISVDAPAAVETLLANLDSIRLENHVAAAALIIVAPDKVIYNGALGVRDWKTQLPVTRDTLFRIGSITKAFTGLALLKAQERGQIDLTMPLTTYLPDAPLINPWKKTHPVRVGQLLEHTAGLLDLNAAEFSSNDPQPLTLRQGLFFNNAPRKIQWPPGLYASYTNVGAGYAAAALEKVTGKQYETIIHEDLFVPLAMRSASLLLDKHTQQQLATGYDTDGRTVIPYWHMVMRPFGAINSSVTEMGNFVQMLLNEGRFKREQVFSPASISRMETPQTTLAARAGLRYGYGLGNYASTHRGFVFHGHGGDADGYLSRYGYNRDTQRGYFLVINAFNNRALALMQEEIEDFIVTGRSKRLTAETPLTLSQLEALTGRYQAVTRRFSWSSDAAMRADQLQVSLAEGQLYLQTPSGKRRPIYAVTPGQFRYGDESVATMAFVNTGKQMILQGDFGNYKKIEKK